MSGQEIVPSVGLAGRQIGRTFVAYMKADGTMCPCGILLGISTDMLRLEVPGGSVVWEVKLSPSLRLCEETITKISPCWGGVRSVGEPVEEAIGAKGGAKFDGGAYKVRMYGIPRIPTRSPRYYHEGMYSQENQHQPHLSSQE